MLVEESGAQTVTSRQVEWWRGASIYQIYPRSFADSNGDGVGDLAGITAHLDHVARLGVDAVWLSPIFASPMRDFGYDVADYCDVDPIFGTLADFDALVERTHSLGLKLILDQVYSHSSDQHNWFRDSRLSRSSAKADWYVWADAREDGTPPNNWQSVFGGPAWTWDARRGQYYLHNFLAEQPDLNLHNSEVQDAILGVASFWLARGVDGFRLDAINFAMHDPSLRDNPVADPGGKRTRPFDYQKHVYNQSHSDIAPFIERLRRLADSFGGVFMLAEVGGENALREMQEFTTGENRLHSAYGFDFLYAQALTPVLVATATEAWPDAPGFGWPSWAFENHDAPRASSRWAPSGDADAFARMKLLLLAALRGSIILYQGEELGLTQVEVPFERLRDPEAIANWPQTLNRDGARTPIPWLSGADHFGFSTGEPWLPFGPDHGQRAIDRQEAKPGSVLHFARACLELRGATPALRLGTMTIRQAGEQLLQFEREHRGIRLLCSFNLSGRPVECDSGANVLVACGNHSSTVLQPWSAVVAKLSR